MLFPEARRAVEQVAGLPPVHAEGYDIAAAREEARRVAAAEPREQMAEVQDLDVDGVPVRLYVPAGHERGLVVHLHGGGFVFGDIEVHDAASRRFAHRCGLAVLSVDYRRPPEHRFPAAPEDVDTVVAWLDRHRGLPPGPRFIHGDSAGGNLALVAALRNPDVFAAAVLIYPFLDPTAGFDSYVSAAEGFDRRTAAWYWEQYAATSADLMDPDFAPLLSGRLHTLPPTLIATAEHDPLRDEGEHLAELLADAGVEVTATRYLGQIHGFWRHPSVFPSAEALIGQVAAYLSQRL